MSYFVVSGEEFETLDFNMYWETLEQFEVWKGSDMFKQAHAHKGPPSGESPILGSEIIIAKVASSTK